jgi:cytochrome c-type biogenesis protein CcmF
MLGRGLLVSALGFAAYASFAAPMATRRDGSGGRVVVRPELLDSARRAIVASAVAIAGSAVLLWFAFFTRDFSIAYVAENTNRTAAPWYTFSALWAGMSGSLLLWCLILGVFAAVFAGRRAPQREPFVAWSIPVLGTALVFFLAITAGPENPFARVEVIAPDGRGLNPLLHSPGMIIHPPMLYTGLVSLTVPFAITVAALVSGRTGADWIALVRRWMLVPFLALGAGLVLGGAWAYTELGWGGYWGWDAVENAALLPWLAVAAFIHSAMVQERRGMLKVWNAFLVTAAAVLATFGTFLTRSGLLSSVHTFAESPVGRYFFVFLGLQTLVGLGLLAWRLPMLRAPARIDAAVSKETAFLANNLLFIAAVFVVLWGTVLPLLSEAIWGTQLAVGPPFFNRVMAPLGAALLLLATVGTVVPWRRGSAGAIAARLVRPAIAATVAAAIALVLSRRAALAGVVWVAALLAATSVFETIRGVRGGASPPVVDGARRARIADVYARNPRRYGGYLVHLGVAVMVIGFAGSIARTQTEVAAEPGDTWRFGGYTFEFRRLDRFQAPDKDVNLAVLGLSRNGRHVATLRPQLNLHLNWDQPQSEIAIRTTPAADLYVVLAGSDDQTGDAIFRIHRNPLVFWVWIGSIIAMAGGLIAALGGRRGRPPAQRPTTTPEHELVDS